MEGIKNVIFWPFPKYRHSFPWLDIFLKALIKVQVPVYEGAEPAALKMQPIVFSHGLSANRMSYSGFNMELASCGYCVFTISHNDTSSDYTPKVGKFNSTTKAHDYNLRKYQVTIRENEILGLARDVDSKEVLRLISSEWEMVKLTEDLVLLGHSFGGVSVFGAASRCLKAKAVVGIDPWFFPRHKDQIGSADHQKSCIMLSEKWWPCIARWTQGECHIDKEIIKFSNNSVHKPDEFELKGLDHFNQSDMMILIPFEENLRASGGKLMPHPQYLEHYLVNIWLAMDFLERQGLCSNPEMQKDIKPRLAAVRHIFE